MGIIYLKRNTSYFMIAGSKILHANTIGVINSLTPEDFYGNPLNENCEQSNIEEFTESLADAAEASNLNFFSDMAQQHFKL